MNWMRRMTIRVGGQSETICPGYSIFKLKTMSLNPAQESRDFSWD